jgi:hypothetical protein
MHAWHGVRSLSLCNVMHRQKRGGRCIRKIMMHAGRNGQVMHAGKRGTKQVAATAAAVVGIGLRKKARKCAADTCARIAATSAEG